MNGITFATVIGEWPTSSQHFKLLQQMGVASVRNDLAGKTIVIVGGTSGLGLAGARACIEAGSQVVVVGRSEDKCRSATEELGQSCRAVSGDAADESTVAEAIALAVTDFDQLDGLYHVAGGSGRAHGDGPLHDIQNEGWDYTLRSNLTSTFFSNRAAVRQFRKQATGGAILNMSSVLAYSPASPHFSTHAYAASKAAIIGMTRAAAAEYASENIRLNVLCPALVETPMAERACGNETIMEFIRNKQPLDGGRVGQPGDLDQAVVFFLSDASRFVTGQTLAIDGGWSVS